MCEYASYMGSSVLVTCRSHRGHTGVTADDNADPTHGLLAHRPVPPRVPSQWFFLSSAAPIAAIRRGEDFSVQHCSSN